MVAQALLLAAASVSLSVWPQSPRTARLQAELATVLEQMGATVRVGPEAEASCSGACAQVLVQLRDEGAVLVARRGPGSATALVELRSADAEFDQVHALALQIRDLVDRLPPWSAARPEPRRPERPAARASPPREPGGPPVPSPAAAPPSPAVPPPATEPTREVKVPPSAPAPPPPAAPLPEPRRDAPFGIGAGFVAQLASDSDFRAGGLLLTARFPLWATVDARLSVGLFPSRLRNGTIGRHSIQFLPATLVASVPVGTPLLRLGLGVELVDASIEFATAGLDSATSLSLGPMAQLEARLPVASLISLHLALGVACQPFQQRNEVGNNTPFGFPTWSVLGTVAAELTLRR